MSCPVCRNEYDSTKRQPMLGFCGHTICYTCRASMFNHSCPVSVWCGRIPSAFLVPTVNYKMMDFADYRKSLRKKLAEFKRGRPIPSKEEIAERARIKVEARLVEMDTDRFAQEEKLVQIQQAKIDLEKEVEELEEQVRKKFGTSNIRNHSCVECDDAVPLHLAFVCAVCCSGLNKDVTIKEEKKVLEEAVCGSCMLDSKHRTAGHSSVSVMSLLNRRRVKERCTAMFAKLAEARKRIDKERAHTISKEFLFQLQDALDAKSKEQCDTHLDRILEYAARSLDRLQKRGEKAESFQELTTPVSKNERTTVKPRSPPSSPNGDSVEIVEEAASDSYILESQQQINGNTSLSEVQQLNAKRVKQRCAAMFIQLQEAARLIDKDRAETIKNELLVQLQIAISAKSEEACDTHLNRFLENASRSLDRLRKIAERARSKDVNSPISKTARAESARSPPSSPDEDIIEIVEISSVPLGNRSSPNQQEQPNNSKKRASPNDHHVPESKRRQTNHNADVELIDLE